MVTAEIRGDYQKTINEAKRPKAGPDPLWRRKDIIYFDVQCASRWTGMQMTSLFITSN